MHKIGQQSAGLLRVREYTPTGSKPRGGAQGRRLSLTYKFGLCVLASPGWYFRHGNHPELPRKQSATAILALPVAG
jgi:hypothetical protein